MSSSGCRRRAGLTGRTSVPACDLSSNDTFGDVIVLVGELIFSPSGAMLVVIVVVLLLGVDLLGLCSGDRVAAIALCAPLIDGVGVFNTVGIVCML